MRHAWLLAALTAACGLAGPEPVAYLPNADAPRCAIWRVVDGDTVEMSCGDGPSTNVRLTGFDTPETWKPRCASERARGDAATRFLSRILRAAEQIDPRIMGDDRYGRPLVALTLDGVPLAEIMIDAGLAVAYDGGKRRSWCQ